MALSEKLKRLQAMEKTINKKFGEGAVMKGSDAVKAGKLDKQILPTPSAELNKALHCGGLAGIVDLFGPESSGKTSLAIEVLAKAQKENPEFVGAWLETEESVTADVLREHGVDLDRLIYWDQKTAGNAENALDIFRAYIASHEINMFIVNSVAGLSPKTEIEEDLTKQNPAVTARIMSKLFRTIMSTIDLSNTTLVFINQERDNIGQMFGNPAQATGGKALKFYSFQRIRMSRLKIDQSSPITSEEGIKVGFNVYKNRFSGTKDPYMKGEYYARYDSGIDSYVAIPGQLVEAGIVERRGSWYYYNGPNGEVMEIDGVQCKFQSQKIFIDALRSKPKLFEYFLGMLSGRKMSPDEIKQAEADNEEGKEFIAQAEADNTENKEDEFLTQLESQIEGIEKDSKIEPIPET